MYNNYKGLGPCWKEMGSRINDFIILWKANLKTHMEGRIVEPQERELWNYTDLGSNPNFTTQ